MRGHVIVGVMTISTDDDKLYDTDLTDAAWALNSADVAGSTARWPTTGNQHSRCVERNLLIYCEQAANCVCFLESFQGGASVLATGKWPSWPGSSAYASPHNSTMGHTLHPSV
jgi:hypothetical protein